MSADTRLEELGVSGLGEVDEPAFSGLVERHRRELHVHCYRGGALEPGVEDAPHLGQAGHVVQGAVQMAGVAPLGPAGGVTGAREETPEVS